jgi:hypothetical protein
MRSAPAARLSLPDRPPTVSQEPPKPQPTPASKAPVSARARTIALLEIVGAVLVLYLGLRFDDTVLHGNASLLSVALHGLAFYGIGAGLAGLRP